MIFFVILAAISGFNVTETIELPPRDVSVKERKEREDFPDDLCRVVIDSMQTATIIYKEGNELIALEFSEKNLKNQSFEVSGIGFYAQFDSVFKAFKESIADTLDLSVKIDADWRAFYGLITQVMVAARDNDLKMVFTMKPVFVKP